jgi:glycosyltransferase involved in cell wall biosynthesis
MTADALRVSIVMPVLNERARLAPALTRLAHDHPGCDIVVVDGGSTDGSAEIAVAIARDLRPATVRVLAAPTGRGRQLNAGAAAAAGDCCGSCTPTPRSSRRRGCSCWQR